MIADMGPGLGGDLDLDLDLGDLDPEAEARTFSDVVRLPKLRER